MAEGVRIQPQPDRLKAQNIESAAHRLFILRDRSRPFTDNPNRSICVTCGTPHECKTYHLKMGADGTTIVSTGVWEQLQRMPDHGGFEIVNTVTEPPAQGIVLPPAVLELRPNNPAAKKGK